MIPSIIEFNLVKINLELGKLFKDLMKDSNNDKNKIRKLLEAANYADSQGLNDVGNYLRNKADIIKKTSEE